jgi:hypothetical protein
MVVRGQFYITAALPPTPQGYLPRNDVGGKMQLNSYLKILLD